jgi:hypothetical protein
MTSWPPELVQGQAGGDVHPQLAAAGEDVGGAVLIGAQERAEAGRRLGEPVHLLLEGHDLVASLSQGGREPLVLSGDSGQVGLELYDPLLEDPRVPRRFCDLAAQDSNLLLKKGNLTEGFLRAPCGPAAAGVVVVVGCHGPHLLRGAERDPTLPAPRLVGTPRSESRKGCV